jgi:hypothetical protein
MPAINVQSATPILVVPSIEPCLVFWQALGFAPTMTVPDASPFDFAILHRGGIEIMLQTRASVAGDTPAVAEHVRASVLYLSVDSLEPILAAFAEAPVAVPRRTTFYGADEIFLHDPAGNIIGFAAQAPDAIPPA